MGGWMNKFVPRNLNDWYRMKNKWLKEVHRTMMIVATLISAAACQGEVAPGQTVQMDQERWDEHIKAYPDAKQFRYKPLPHADEMEQLFGGGVTATGDHIFGFADVDNLVDDHKSTSHNPTLITETPSPPPAPEEQGEPDPVTTETNYEERMSEV
ncbi:hypothetical protein QJS10_CPB18g01109 [Acorus calamus]|uniref:Uncharacterized protein n=1 Tax=Acorus calamus TaxID=4465 RepID=A0AAV9CLE0_ACOCL|nr:hypothetical protein QJS10_CPB18g01109 [Acorus calamus]